MILFLNKKIIPYREGMRYDLSLVHRKNVNMKGYTINVS